MRPLLVLAAVAFVVAGSAHASTPTSCLVSSTTKSLNTDAIVSGLEITRDQKRELRARLSQYNSISGFEGYDGVGLTPDQIALVEKRIAAQVARWNAHPLGWPCAPFTHRTRTVAWVRETLVDNGFRRASIRVTNAVPRQLQFVGIQDGIDVSIIVARQGARGVLISLTTSHSGGGTYSYVLPFVP